MTAWVVLLIATGATLWWIGWVAYDQWITKKEHERDWRRTGHENSDAREER